MSHPTDPNCIFCKIVAGQVPSFKLLEDEATVAFMRQFKVDIALIGISGIEADGSLRDFDYREVSVARAILEQSREIWLAADHSKFHRPAMVELARLDHLDRLFTDAPPPPPFTQMLAEAAVQCTVAP